MDTLGYVLPIVFGAVAISVLAYVPAYVHDLVWCFEHCRYIDQMRGDSTPGVLPTVCYLQAAGSLVASFATLCVTLRYKRLMSKNIKIGNHRFVSANYELDDNMVRVYFSGGSIGLKRECYFCSTL